MRKLQQMHAVRQTGTGIYVSVIRPIKTTFIHSRGDNIWT